MDERRRESHVAQIRKLGHIFMAHGLGLLGVAALLKGEVPNDEEAEHIYLGLYKVERWAEEFEGKPIAEELRELVEEAREECMKLYKDGRCQQLRARALDRKAQEREEGAEDSGEGMVGVVNGFAYVLPDEAGAGKEGENGVAD